MEVDTILTNLDNIRLKRPKDVKDEVKHIVTVVESPTGTQVEGPVDRSRGPNVFDIYIHICEV